MKINYDDNGNCYLNGGATIYEKDGKPPMVTIQLTLESLKQAVKEHEDFTRTWSSKKDNKEYHDVTICAFERREKGSFHNTHYLKMMKPKTQEVVKEEEDAKVSEPLF